MTQLSGTEIPSDVHPTDQSASSQGPSTGQRPASDEHIDADNVGFFKALFDFRFKHFITVKFSSLLYIIAWIVAVLLWGWNILMGIFLGFLFGAMFSDYGDISFSPLPLISALLLGWIPSVISIIFMRLGLEFSVATVRTAQNTGALADRAARH